VGGAAELAALHEGARVDQARNALAGRGEPRFIAACLGPLAARVLGLFEAFPQIGEFGGGGGKSHVSHCPFRSSDPRSRRRSVSQEPTFEISGSSTIARWSPLRWTISKSSTIADQPPSSSIVA